MNIDQNRKIQLAKMIMDESKYALTMYSDLDKSETEDYKNFFLEWYLLFLHETGDKIGYIVLSELIRNSEYIDEKMMHTVSDDMYFEFALRCLHSSASQHV